MSLMLLANCSRSPFCTQSREGGTPRFREWDLFQLGTHSYQIDCSGSQDMLQVRFGQSDVTGTAHIQGTHRLRNRTFYSCTLVIALFAHLAILAEVVRRQEPDVPYADGA